MRHTIFPLLILSLMLSGCGNGSARSSTTEKTGSGGLMIGQDRDTVEKNNPKWTLHKVTVDDVSTVATYRDYHWSLARGFAHSAEYHHITYGHDQKVIAWVSNSNPDEAKK